MQPDSIEQEDLRLMREIADQNLMVLMTLVVVMANALWFFVKWNLSKQGKEVSWFLDHSRDFRLLREVIADAPSDAVRRRFEKLLLAMYGMMAIVAICFISIVAVFFVGR